jgi:hypothetical protein
MRSKEFYWNLKIIFEFPIHYYPTDGSPERAIAISDSEYLLSKSFPSK